MYAYDGVKGWTIGYCLLALTQEKHLKKNKT
jgi:hypothetical protein